MRIITGLFNAVIMLLPLALIGIAVYYLGHAVGAW